MSKIKNDCLKNNQQQRRVIYVNSVKKNKISVNLKNIYKSYIFLDFFNQNTTNDVTSLVGEENRKMVV